MSRIDRRFNVPVNAILAVALFNVLFGLLYLGPAVAYNAYISSCTIFLNCSYAGPIIILLVRGRDTIMLERPDFPLGRIGGYILNYVSVIYIIVTSAVCGTLHLSTRSPQIFSDHAYAVLPLASHCCRGHTDNE